MHFDFQVDSIASVFIHQLTEARHRGAFEMAYCGFQKLCQSLWTSNCSEFQLMPSLWVEELLDSLQSKSVSRLLSITRRSAGLPFYLQVLDIVHLHFYLYCCMYPNTCIRMYMHTCVTYRYKHGSEHIKAML